MEKNVGGTDRTVRWILGPLLVIVGAALAAGLLTEATTTVLAGGVVLALVGLVLLYTAYSQKCFINDILGIDTYRP